MNAAVILILISAILLGGFFILCLFRLSRTLTRLDQMLDNALENTFEENAFDESRLSALETKLHHFLSASRARSSRIVSERDQVQTLIGDISHQTKTPIANLRLYSDLLAEQSGLPESAQMLADEIGRQSAKLDFLIQSLIKASRLENGIVQVSPETSAMDVLLESAALGVLKKAQNRSVTLIMDVPQNLSACFDLKWTAEALYNILDNALKYTPPGGEIHVTAQAYELFCRIDVSDTGIGISEDEIPKIFSRFYRSSAVSQEEGVGIGLYLSREIITLQGGYIKVSSEPGKGSCFSVFLPRSFQKKEETSAF
ncbi:Signal transduction histidine kinase [Eubacterium maltosivorans]|uniref:sensor histidine kinase n=1 Tax=Eubacterium maltosivorans TaxID=2041044 RepID=UPI00088F935C|nr:HAMP domain-containing sensor histidine kinase [Eubacterium maltosivorans]WPK81006.1 Adaptive-response sensory-kinase SasA [Eubacterium maltosivorans]SDP48321.1 Signal transduction histidine kinase [Eubacterium maltosivorans]